MRLKTEADGDAVSRCGRETWGGEGQQGIPPGETTVIARRLSAEDVKEEVKEEIRWMM